MFKLRPTQALMSAVAAHFRAPHLWRWRQLRRCDSGTGEHSGATSFTSLPYPLLDCLPCIQPRVVIETHGQRQGRSFWAAFRHLLLSRFSGIGPKRQLVGP